MSETSPTLSLAARYYTDPQIYQQELQGLLATTWQFAGHQRQLQNTGDYFTFEIAGQNLFCIRGEDGVIRTFYNVCQHRAHELVSGQGCTKKLVCPYHAWAYALTGELQSGPNIRVVPGFDKTRVRLTEVRTENWLGFIFVNLDPEARSMDEWFPGTREQIAEWLPHWQALAPMEWVSVPEQCNWKVSVENYSECYHCLLNHPTFSTGVIKPKSYDIQPQGYCLRHTTECQNLDKMTYPIDTSRPHAESYSSWYLWPMFSFQVYPGNVLNTYHWRTVDAHNVVVWRGWFSEDGQQDEVIQKLAVQDRETTVEEDIHLVESVQRGLSSRGYVPGPLVLDPGCGVQSEHSIQTLQQWFREAVDQRAQV